MHIREVTDAQLYADSDVAATTTVGGFPVYMTTLKYAGEKWATFIVTSKNRKVLEIEVGTRIDSPQRKAALDALVARLLTSP
jgi:hypothetical protein